MDQINLGGSGQQPGKDSSVERARPPNPANGGVADSGEAKAHSTVQKLNPKYDGVWDDVRYRYLILADKGYIVFIDAEGDLDWKTTDEYDAGLKGEPLYKRELHAAVLNEAALLEATPCDGLLASIKIQFKRLVGEALARSFDHDYAGANRMVAAAQRYIRIRSEEVSRHWYLSASIAMALVFLLLGAIVWLGRGAFRPLLAAEGVWIVIASAAGAVGALLSVILRSGELKFDPSAGKTLHYLEGASRIIAGSISGLVVAAAVHSGLLLSTLATGDKRQTILLLAAFAGGSGERLAGSIISRFDTSSVKSESPPADGKIGATSDKPATDGKAAAGKAPVPDQSKA